MFVVLQDLFNVLTMETTFCPYFFLSLKLIFTLAFQKNAIKQ